MTRTPEIFGSSIVALGAFNPAIFSADWLEQNKLIGAADAEDIRKKPSYIVSQKVSSIESKWFVLQVLENQFSLSSNGALSPALKDLAVSILTLTPHTPIKAVGLNFYGHYKMANAADFHKVGDVLAPKKIWDDLFPGERFSKGLADLTIRVWEAPERQDPETGRQQNISLQPSNLIKQAIFISFNDHFDIRIEKDEETTTATKTVSVIDNEWELTWEKATTVFNGIFSKALEE